VVSSNRSFLQVSNGKAMAYFNFADATDTLSDRTLQVQYEQFKENLKS